MSAKLKPANSYPKETHLAIINNLSAKGPAFSYVGLIRSIMDVAASLHIKVRQNKAKLFAEHYYKTEDFIIKKDSGVYVINEQYLDKKTKEPVSSLFPMKG